MSGIKSEVNLIKSKFAAPDNEVGLGKLIYLQELNETIISNGKSLVSISGELSKNNKVTEDEIERMKTLSTRLIHLNFGEQSLCELMLNKEDMIDLLTFLYSNREGYIELVFNKELGVLLLKANGISYVKILKDKAINQFKCEDATVTVEALELFNVLSVVTDSLNDAGIVGLATQSNNKPLLIESDNVKACITISKL